MKLTIVQRKMDRLKEEMLALQSYGEGSAAYVVKLDKLLGKVKRARTPRSNSESEVEDGSEGQDSEQSQLDRGVPDVVAKAQESSAGWQTRLSTTAQSDRREGVNGSAHVASTKSRGPHRARGDVTALSNDNDEKNDDDNGAPDEDNQNDGDAVAGNAVNGDGDAEHVEEHGQVDNGPRYEPDNDRQQVSDSESSSQDELPIEDPTSQDNHPPLSDAEDAEEEGVVTYSEGEETAVTPSAQGDDMTDYSEPVDITTLQKKKKRKGIGSRSSVNSSAQTRVSNGSVEKGRGRGYARGRGRGRRT